MTVVYGLDRSAPLSAADAAAAIANGYTFVCGYIYGNTPKIWTVANIRVVVDAGLAFVPVGVALIASGQSYDSGISDGNGMLAAMQARGLSGVGVMDYENGIVDQDHGQGFNDAMHAGSASTMIYGQASSLVAMAGPWDLYWLAKWEGFMSGLQPAPPDWDMWQVEDGSPYDFNMARSDFPFGTFSG